MPVDVRLVAILDGDVLGTRDPVDAARAAQAGGATLVQLRMKSAPAGTLYDVAGRLISGVTIPVYINDRADVALAAGAAGVHLGADDIPAARLQPVAPADFGFGVSVGSAGEARIAGQAAATYWSLGPFFPAAHKPDAGEPIGPEGFRSLARLAPPGTPVIAIGGITAHNVAGVIAAGARGVAVIGAIFGTPGIERATRTLRDEIDRALAGTGRAASR